jgi:endonuclease G
MRRYALRAFLLLAVTATGFLPSANAQLAVNLRMGNPNGATEDPSKTDNFLMDKKFYAVSYNDDLGTPNWVSWRLTKDDLGNVGRKAFKPDTTLPGGFERITPADYSGSGFDRGHMCPHSDRAATAASSTSTFLMTNMVPQSAENNQKAWNQLELYLRDLVQNKGKVCYIVAGPSGRGGVGKNGFKVNTPNGNVVVPSKTWKVVMVLDQDVASASEITEDTHVRLIAVVVPNDRSPGLDWTEFRVTVKEVERMTKYTFFGSVDPDVIKPLKGLEDDIPVGPPLPVDHGH